MRLLALLLVGCASAGVNGGTLPDGSTADAVTVTVADAAAVAVPDAAAAAVADAAAVAVPDAAAAAVPDAAPVAVPDACVPGWTPLLTNGNFDQGHVAWSESPASSVLSSSPPLTPDSGAWVAWFDGVNNADDVISESVTVPATTTALRLRGKKCFVTTETSGVWDYLTVSAGAETLVTWSNDDGGSVCNWSSFTLDAGSAHAGETIALRVEGTTDGGHPTSFYLDSLVLEAYACP